MSAPRLIYPAFSVIAFFLALPVVHGCSEKKEEPIICECTPGVSETCTTPCGSEGLLACKLDCMWSDCMIPPEQCNGIDDDCDGEVDEAFQCIQGETRSCITSCESEGTEFCNERCRLETCIGVEACNGVDDDCDGEADNGFECVRGEAVSCVTPCGVTRNGTCDDDCTIPVAELCAPPADECNGIDDDCDGSIDDGMECALGGVEVCIASCGSEGTRTCGNLCTWGACVPPEEICNDLDDDCDGNIDNGFECNIGTSEDCITYCGSTGTRTCGLCTWGGCMPPEEVCNGLDDNCNGFTDENYGKIGSDVRITEASDYSRLSFLVFTGSEYGVSWGDNREGSTEVYFARISSSGVKVGDDVRLTDASGSSWFPSLVFTGSEYALSWYDGRDGNNEIYFARLSSSGVKVGDDVRLTDAAGTSRYPRLVYTGSEYAVSWSDDRDGNDEIYFVRISASGVKEGSDVRITNAAGISMYPSLVYTGSEYAVCWNDDRNGNDEIYFARISTSGVKVGGDMRMTNASGSSTYSSLVYTGSEYGVSWSDERDGNMEIYFARISTSGVKEGGDLRITDDPTSSWGASLVYTGSEYGLSWHGNRDGNYEIYFSRISSSGVKQGGEARITDSSGISEFSSLVHTGSEYGVSWNDSRDGNSEIYFARINCI